MPAMDRLRVLIVDDEQDIQDLFRRMLQAEYEITLAGNFEQAISEITGSRPPQLIISDINMPGKSGIELLRYARRSHPDIPVILLTGYGSKEVAIEAIKEGAYDFIEKPVPQTLLHRTTQRAAQHIRARYELAHAQLMSIESERLATIGSMASIIMHEIVNPLAIISGIANILESKAGQLNSQEITEKAQKIKEMVRRSSRLTDSLKNLSRRPTGKPENVALKKIIDDATTLCGPSLKKYGVRLFVDSAIGEQDLKVSCDRVEVSQVFVNLINNSCQALQNSKEKWIKITIESLDDPISISVIDSGHGISDEVACHMFEIFYTTKPVGIGTGLGLNTARRMMESNRGGIEYAKDRANTTFLVTIPLSCQAEQVV